MKFKHRYNIIKFVRSTKSGLKLIVLNESFKYLVIREEFKRKEQWISNSLNTKYKYIYQIFDRFYYHNDFAKPIHNTNQITNISTYPKL